MGVRGKDYFIDGHNCKEYRQLLLEQNKEAAKYQNYLGEMGYGN